MKKHLGSILMLLACSTLTLSVVTSCSKSSSNIAGTYTGTLLDSVSIAANDTVVISVSGNTVTVNDHATGSTFTGTLGTATTSGYITTTPITFTSVSIKQGTTTGTYSNSTVVGSSFTYESAGGVTEHSVGINLTDASGSVFEFSGLY